MLSDMQLGVFVFTRFVTAQPTAIKLREFYLSSVIASESEAIQALLA